ncbi:hypothetical protein L3i22_029070 [Actinoplanes sp. L3-i22]|nr:hypothetical protein L3i22_029070 [Actinoplanes sp. L3-i22]
MRVDQGGHAYQGPVTGLGGSGEGTGKVRGSGAELGQNCGGSAAEVRRECGGSEAGVRRKRGREWEEWDGSGERGREARAER